jgi:hypothetical protein
MMPCHVDFSDLMIESSKVSKKKKKQWWTRYATACLGQIPSDVIYQLHA